MAPTFPRDYHRHEEHTWTNNRHNLDPYYLRDGDSYRPNVYRRERSLSYMTKLTLAIIAALILAAYTVAHYDTVQAQYQPTTISENIDQYSMDLYDYYAKRSRP